MAVGLEAPGRIHPVGGIRLASTHSGIKADPAIKDLVLVEIAEGSSVAGVFTRSHFSAAPVTVCRRHLEAGDDIRYLLINSGNANAGTGDAGIEAAMACCEDLAKTGKSKPRQVLPFSTGVIAEPLPVNRITAAVPGLLEALDEDRWLQAAEGIMTTDTLPKAISVRLEIEGRAVTLSGIAKGSGMIKPDMATMLAFVATDAAIEHSELEGMLSAAVASSFNAITVDGDTSTNDSCILIATGRSGVSIDRKCEAFQQALLQLFEKLAQAIIRDAEGATKFVEIEVEGADSQTDARSLAFTIAESPLVKTALFASDPNWGRLIMAIGRAPLQRIDPQKVDLYLGEVRLLHQGLPDTDYREELGQAEFSREEIQIRVNLNIGHQRMRVWTSDLSHEYVRINAEYRS